MQIKMKTPRRQELYDIFRDIKSAFEYQPERSEDDLTNEFFKRLRSWEEKYIDKPG